MGREGNDIVGENVDISLRMGGLNDSALVACKIVDLTRVVTPEECNCFAVRAAARHVSQSYDPRERPTHATTLKLIGTLSTIFSRYYAEQTLAA